MKKRNMKKLWTVLSVVTATLLVIAIAGYTIAYSYETLLNATFGLKNYRVVDTGDGTENTEYFTAKLNDGTAIHDHSADVSERLEAEGLVLLKNDGALPLTGDGLKVSLFGTGSVNINCSVQGMRGGVGGAVDSASTMIHQEISLIHEMSVAENIWLGREKDFSSFGLLNVRAREQSTWELLKKLDLDFDPHQRVGDLSIARMQLVEVARAVSYNSDVIIMDEPTSALTDVEIEKLFRIIRNITAEGKSVIFISHKLEELFEVCDRITVFRDGKFIGCEPKEKLNKDLLVSMMVGRPLTDMYPKETIPIGPVTLSCRDLCRKGSFEHVSFSAHEGEILGFCGLMGAQRTEIMQAIFGLDPLDSEEILVRGKPVRNRSPKAAIANHFSLVTEDRLRRGALHRLSIKVNTSLAYLRSICRFGFIKIRQGTEDCDRMVQQMNVKLHTVQQSIGSLSGGNQQKVILGRWLLTDPDILILDEPTRGIDVGAKSEIYRMIGNLAKARKTILMVSSELPELMGICDRILVVRGGRLVAEVAREDFSQDLLMSYAFGVKQQEAYA